MELIKARVRRLGARSALGVRRANVPHVAYTELGGSVEYSLGVIQKQCALGIEVAALLQLRPKSLVFFWRAEDLTGINVIHAIRQRQRIFLYA